MAFDLTELNVLHFMFLVLNETFSKFSYRATNFQIIYENLNFPNVISSNFKFE